jgi:hypothetical protein
MAKMTSFLPSFYHKQIHKTCHLSVFDILFVSSTPLPQLTSPLKCLSPADLRTGRPESEDAHHFHSPCTSEDHHEGSHPSNSSTVPQSATAHQPSQDSASTQTLPASTNLPPTALDLHHHNMHGIFSHILALLNSPWPCIVHRLPFSDRCSNHPSWNEHHQPQRSKHFPAVHALLPYHPWKPDCHQRLRGSRSKTCLPYKIQEGSSGEGEDKAHYSQRAASLLAILVRQEYRVGVASETDPSLRFE